MLCTVGDLVEEIVAVVATDPHRGGEARAATARMPGGRSGVVAMTARWAGAPARIISQLGADAPGRSVDEQLAGLGIERIGPLLGRTGTTVIVVDTEREATRLVDRGSSVKLSNMPDQALEGCRLLHVPLSALVQEPLATAASELIGQAIDEGIALAIDLVSPETVEAFGAAEAAALVRTAGPAFVFGSRIELTGLRQGPRDPVVGAALTIATDGARPTLAVDAAGQVTSTPVRPLTTLVDRSGRGGAFVGGFLAAHLAGSGTTTAVLAGHRAAAVVLASPGGRPRGTA